MKSAAVVAALLMSSAGHATSFYDGNELLDRLSRPAPDYKVGVAFGYVIGIADAYADTRICTPKNVTAGQVVDVVHKWLKDTPSERHYTADSLVLHVLSSTWPCPGREPSGGRP